MNDALTDSAYQKKLDRWIFDIRRGRYPMRALLDAEMRNTVEQQLLSEYDNGTLPDTGLDALIDYNRTLIAIGGRTIDNVPDSIRSIVEQANDRPQDFHTYVYGNSKS